MPIMPDFACDFSKGMENELERIGLNTIKTESVRAVFSCIAREKEVSRAAIAEKTSLSLMTVGKVADLLLARDVLVQSVPAKAGAGRRAGVLCLHPDKRLVVLDISTCSFSFAVLNMALEVLDTVEYTYNKAFDLAENISLFLKTVKIYMLRNITEGDAVGVGIMVSGTWSARDDTVMGSRIVGMEDVHVRHMTEDVLGLPVTAVENSISSATTALSQYAEAGKVAFYLSIGEVLKSALFVDGKLLQGRDGNAGNIANVPSGKGKTLGMLYLEKGMCDEVQQPLISAIAGVISLTDPTAVYIETFSRRPLAFAKTLIPRLCAATGKAAEELPHIELGSHALRYAYEGLAQKVRAAWVETEI